MGMRAVRNYLLWGVLGVGVLAGVALILFNTRTRKVYQHSFPDNSYVRIVQLEYARESRITRWHFKVARPFLQRQVYQTPVSPHPEYLLWMERAYGDYPVAWWARDSHGCEYPLKTQPRCFGLYHCEAIFNLPTDGQRMVIQMRSHGSQTLIEYPIQCVHEPLNLPPPEALPATKQLRNVRLTLESVRWRVVREKWYKTNQDPVAAPSFTRFKVMVYPKLRVVPSGWRPTRAAVATLYDKDPQIIERAHDTRAAVLQDCWRQPVYRLYVQVEHSGSGRREVFEFLIPPPPQNLIDAPEEETIFY